MNMKKFLLSLVAMLIVGVATIHAQAVITFDKTTHNFGTFKEDVVQKHVFTFKNTGDKPLIIQQVATSCGCTASNYTKEPVAPGKTGQVEVTYNGKGKFAGHFKKTITINSNSKQPMTTLYIEGDMTANTKK